MCDWCTHDVRGVSLVDTSAHLLPQKEVQCHNSSNSLIKSVISSVIAPNLSFAIVKVSHLIELHQLGHHVCHVNGVACCLHTPPFIEKTRKVNMSEHTGNQ